MLELAEPLEVTSDDVATSGYSLTLTFEGRYDVRNNVGFYTQTYRDPPTGPNEEGVGGKEGVEKLVASDIGYSE